MGEFSSVVHGHPIARLRDGVHYVGKLFPRAVLVCKNARVWPTDILCSQKSSLQVKVNFRWRFHARWSEFERHKPNFVRGKNREVYQCQRKWNMVSWKIPFFVHKTASAYWRRTKRGNSSSCYKIVTWLCSGYPREMARRFGHAGDVITNIAKPDEHPASSCSNTPACTCVIHSSFHYRISCRQWAQRHRRQRGSRRRDRIMVIKMRCLIDLICLSRTSSPMDQTTKGDFFTTGAPSSTYTASFIWGSEALMCQNGICGIATGTYIYLWYSLFNWGSTFVCRSLGSGHRPVVSSGF